MNSRILTLIVFLLYTAICYPQKSPVDQGNFMASGGLSLTHYSDRDYTTFTFDPAVSYFVSPGLSIGLSLFFQNQSNGSDYSAFGLGPALEYFFNINPTRNEILGSVYPYFGLGFVFLQENYDSYYYDESLSSTAIAANLGLITMISRNAGLYFQIQYTNLNVEDRDSESIVGFNGGIGYFIY